MACGPSLRRSSSFDSRPLRQMGVFTDPGSMIETVTPADASSMRSASAIALSANFDALYGAMKGTATRRVLELIAELESEGVL